MRVFVTGASGFVGSALVPQLHEAGHEVVGLARSEASAAVLEAADVAVHRGSLDDLDALRAGVADADAVVHLAFGHDFASYAAAGETDRRAIEAMGEVLAGSDRPLVITSGTLGLTTGRVGTEEDTADPSSVAAPRIPGERAALALADRGVRSSVVRLAPTVHDASRCAFVTMLIDAARSTGVSGYVGTGENRWPSAHRSDVATLFALALEKAPAGSVLHGVGEEGITLRSIAEAIAARLDVPVRSVAPDAAAEHFGDFTAAVASADAPASSAATRGLLGWEPTGATLLDDVAKGGYFETPAG